jgi:hypothetical protein
MADLPDEPPVTDWPLYHFARLEKAVEAGDHQTAAQAQRELERLGVRVAYGRPSARRQGRRPTQNGHREAAHATP